MKLNGGGGSNEIKLNPCIDKRKADFDGRFKTCIKRFFFFSIQFDFSPIIDALY